MSIFFIGRNIMEQNCIILFYWYYCTEIYYTHNLEIYQGHFCWTHMLLLFYIIRGICLLCTYAVHGPASGQKYFYQISAWSLGVSFFFKIFNVSQKVKKFRKQYFGLFNCIWFCILHIFICWIVSSVFNVILPL